MKRRSDVDVMIEILEDAVARSDAPGSKPREFSEKRELALIYDFIDAKHIRGEVLAHADGPPRGAAMWGITLSGREYLEKLTAARDAKRLRARIAKGAWIVSGWLLGLFTAALKAAIALLMK